MELVSNLGQFVITLLGFCLSGIHYLKSRKQAYFLLTCFYGCFTLGSLYWTLYLLLFSRTPQVFYVSEFGWVASVIFLSILQYALSSTEERNFPCRKAMIALVIGVPLVRDDDRCFLSCYPGPYICPGTDGRCAQAAIFSRRSVVLCDGGICPLDFRLLLAGRLHL